MDEMDAKHKHKNKKLAFSNFLKLFSKDTKEE
jgi:hypothetical protein